MTNIKDTIENHPLVFACILITIGFGIGYAFKEVVAQFNDKVYVDEKKYENLLNTKNNKCEATKNELSEEICTNFLESKDLKVTSKNVSRGTIISPSEKKQVHQIRLSSLFGDRNKKECITHTHAINFVKEFKESNFDDDIREQNKKIFKDHFLGKWICSKGYEVEIYEKPKLDNEGYWEIKAIIKDGALSLGKIIIVDAKLKYNNKYPNFSVGEKYYITGRIIHANDLGFALREAVLTK